MPIHKRLGVNRPKGKEIPMILESIVQRKRLTLKESSYLHSIDQMIKRAETIGPVRSFMEAIQKPGLSIIGEIKKASPSKGIIREDFDPVAIAKEYSQAVDALSVLTEEYFFLGHPSYLENVHKTVDLPILRKDFIIDPLQIYEAKALGASCALLITAILTDKELRSLLKLARALDMEALVEVHTINEIMRAMEAGARMIGINNRNLEDFSVSLQTTLTLSQYISKDILTVSESGIHTEEDIKLLREARIDGILVGESFMTAASIKNKARELREAYEA